MDPTNNDSEKQRVVEGEEGTEHLPDLLGQFPILDNYTHFNFGFELALGVDRDDTVSQLQNGLNLLIEQVPWLGWQMGLRSGVRTAVPWPDGVARQLLRVKYCDDIVLAMDDLLAAGVPISKLDGKVLAPWPGLPLPHGLTGPVPVITLQANFIRGGLILNVSAHHTMMDATAMFQFITLLATVLRGDEIPADDLEQANRDRSRVIDLIPPTEPIKDFSHLRCPPGYEFALPTSPPTWCYFKMPVSTLSRLSRSAQEPARPVTDDDVLHAFYWQRLSAAPLARGHLPPTTTTKLSRAIDARRALGLPPSYMAALIHTAVTRLPLGQVAAGLTLAQLAQVLRRELAQSNTAWAMRSLATFIAREGERPTGRAALLYNGTHDGNTDVGATSGLDTNQTPPVDWGPRLGRRCVFFRRSMGPPIPGAVTVQAAEGGAIPIGVCLPSEDLEALRGDALWRRHTRWVG